MASKQELEDLYKAYTDSRGEFKDKHKKYRYNNIIKVRERDRNFKVKKRGTEELRKARNFKEREYRIGATYGMTLLDYSDMLESQGGGCFLCGAPPMPNSSLNIDHEHVKNYKNLPKDKKRQKVRGLLCHKCNRALGLFGNNTLDLLSIASNLEEYLCNYYAESLINEVGYDEALETMKRVTKYLEEYETRKSK